MLLMAWLELQVLPGFHIGFTVVFTHSCFPPKELEQLAKEQDKESDKQVLLQEVENHKKQMLR